MIFSVIFSEKLIFGNFGYLKQNNYIYFALQSSFNLKLNFL